MFCMPDAVLPIPFRGRQGSRPGVVLSTHKQAPTKKARRTSATLRSSQYPGEGNRHSEEERASFGETGDRRPSRARARFAISVQN